MGDKSLAVETFRRQRVDQQRERVGRCGILRLSGVRGEDHVVVADAGDEGGQCRGVTAGLHSQGVALTRWSLAKLRDHLADGGIDVSAETLRRILNEAGLSHRRTRSWKWSPDPDFATKAERVLSLYREPPEDGPVVCIDEMGPIQPIPHQGSGRAPVGLPERHRASFKRPHGVRYLYGAYDVHDDRLIGRLRPRKGELEVVRFLHTIGMRYDRACASTRSRTTSPATGPRRCAIGPRPPTSSSCRRPPTRAT